jgi:hypothetical protein
MSTYVSLSDIRLMQQAITARRRHDEEETEHVSLIAREEM